VFFTCPTTLNVKLDVLLITPSCSGTSCICEKSKGLKPGDHFIGHGLKPGAFKRTGQLDSSCTDLPSVRKFTMKPRNAASPYIPGL
jgi:hypothetical protein